MAKATQRRLRAIAIFVIFLALAWSGFTSVKTKSAGPDLGVVFKDADIKFRDAGSLNKAEIKLRTMNSGKALDEMNSLITEYSFNKETPLHKERQGAYGSYIFKVEEANYPTLLKKFSQLGSFEGQKEAVDSMLVKKNLVTEQSILEGKRRQLASLDAQEGVYGTLAEHKNNLINEIREQENRVNVLAQGNTRLLLVKVIPSLGGNSLSMVKKFVINFFVALVALFVGTILAYYGTKVIMFLLSMMGVKGFNRSGLGGGYNYGGYGSYGGSSGRYYSRGYGNKRKVKRIYKNKPGTHPSEDAPEEPK